MKLILCGQRFLPTKYTVVYIFKHILLNSLCSLFLNKLIHYDASQNTVHKIVASTQWLDQNLLE